MQLLQVKWLVPLWAGALVLSACGEGSTATTSSVFNLDGTAYQTLPPTVSTLPPTTLPGGPVTGQVTTEVTEYTIQEGDVPVIVADRFDVTLDALTLANADTEGWSSFYVGLVIKIPAGATIPDVTTFTTLPGVVTTTIAGGGDNCGAGSHTIVEGDVPYKVAQKYDVTVEQLAAANVNTAGYSSFYVGLVIVIPPKADC